MIAKTKMQINMGPNKLAESEQKLQSRAARFGTISETNNKSATTTTSNTTTTTTTTTNTTLKATPIKTINPADAEKLAARAARFGDLATNATGQVKPNVSKPAVASNPADAEKFAKRAARFADISTEPEKGVKKANTGTVNTKQLVKPISATAAVVANSAPEANELLAKRAARFASMGAK